MKITIYELLGLVKDGKAPKRIKYDSEIYYYYEEDLDYYTEDRETMKIYLFKNHTNFVLNDTVEILEEEEEKKIPEKLDEYADVSGDLACGWSFAEKKLKDKLNEVIDYLDYLKSKGDE